MKRGSIASTFLGLLLGVALLEFVAGFFLGVSCSILSPGNTFRQEGSRERAEWKRRMTDLRSERKVEEEDFNVRFKRLFKHGVPRTLTLLTPNDRTEWSFLNPSGDHSWSEAEEEKVGETLKLLCGAAGSLDPAVIALQGDGEWECPLVQEILPFDGPLVGGSEPPLFLDCSVVIDGPRVYIDRSLLCQSSMVAASVLYQSARQIYSRAHGRNDAEVGRRIRREIAHDTRRFHLSLRELLQRRQPPGWRHLLGEIECCEEALWQTYRGE